LIEFLNIRGKKVKYPLETKVNADNLLGQSIVDKESRLLI